MNSIHRPTQGYVLGFLVLDTFYLIYKCMKYLKLYENFNNNIEDLLEDIKWIMIEMTESHKLFGHEKDDCFLYEVSNIPTQEDLESAKGRLEDLGYSIVYIGKPKIGSRDIHDKTICWIVKSELCKEYSPLPIIINGKFGHPFY